MTTSPPERTPTEAAGLRLAYVAAVLVLIACGLLWRRPELGLPWGVAKFGGSILWGAMIFFCVAGAAPLQRPLKAALFAAAVAALVEGSQLLHVAILDQFRCTTIGALLLGRTFSWWDIVCYWTGITASWLATSLALHGRPYEAR